MPGSNRNTSQDPDYEGLPYHEKKVHKTHFGAIAGMKRTHPRDDPNWEEFAPGRWRLKLIETRKAARSRGGNS